MQPHHNAIISVGTMGAVVVILDWVFELNHIVVPQKVEDSFLVLLTALVSYLMGLAGGDDKDKGNPTQGAQ